MTATRNYTVYFEVFGKKMKTIVMADSIEDAKQKIRDRIVYHSVEPSKSDAFNQCVDIMDDINDLLKR